MQFFLRGGTILGFLIACGPAPGSQESAGIPIFPFQVTRETAGLDTPAPRAALPKKQVSGPVAPSYQQVSGALAGRIVYTSAGHGWAWNGSGWSLGRPVLNQMNEDYGNLDQMSLFAYYCFNAGATVVPFRPIGNQTNEVVMDNTSPEVEWIGVWQESSSPVYYGAAATVPYHFASTSPEESALAVYAPSLPASGLYPVYAWALHGANRVSQLYRIRHAGGESRVRVPHYLVGNGWIYLGSYYFDAGRNVAYGAVVVSNLEDASRPTGVVIADAIRFGNGMGSIDRGAGVSTYPREEEASRYWVQASLGQGQSNGLYDNPSLSDDSDNVGAPIRMAVEMNREAEGGMFKRVYVSFHSNAGGGRGVLGLYNNPALSPNVAKNSNTPNQLRLAQLLGQEVNNDLSGLSSLLETPWHNRGTAVTFARSDYAFGEINNNIISNEFDATIVEVAYHDNDADARLMRDPKVRNWVARAAYQGVVRYMNQFDAAPLVFVPEPPSVLKATGIGGNVLLSWASPTLQGGASGPASFQIYYSTNGFAFREFVSVTGTNSALLSGLPTGTVHCFRVTSANAGGESMPSETVACRLSQNPRSSRALYVNGFTRFDRMLNLRQTPSPSQYRPPGHDKNTGSIDRVLPRQVNAFDYAVPHAKALASGSGMALDTCQLQSVTNGTMNLPDYNIVLWGAGNQSSADRTFNTAAQQRVAEFRARGGHLMVSGSEVGWDLDRASGPSEADRAFLRAELHASLAADDAGVYQFLPSGSPPLDGRPGGMFDDGTRGIYWVGYPDVLKPEGRGAQPLLIYPGNLGGWAATSYDGSAGGGKVVYFGFPFETITNPEVRADYMKLVLAWFSRAPQITSFEWAGLGAFRLAAEGEPGIGYYLQSSTNLTTWGDEKRLDGADGAFEMLLPRSQGSKFYRLRQAVP